MTDSGLFNTVSDNDIAVLTLSLGTQAYALPISDVVEVAAMVTLTDIADPRPALLGMANRHGDVLPILDLRRMMNQPTPPITSATLFIVVHHEGNHFGLVTTAVHQVVYLSPSTFYHPQTAGKHITQS